MKDITEFGWTLFVIGAIVLAASAFFGFDLGSTRITNLAGNTIGSTLMICGAIFVAAGRIERMSFGQSNAAQSQGQRLEPSVGTSADSSSSELRAEAKGQASDKQDESSGISVPAFGVFILIFGAVFFITFLNM